MTETRTPTLAQTRVLELTRIRRERLLPARGTVLVENGARLGALDIVARSEAVSHIRAVPLGRYLHVSENRLAKFMQKKPGETVAARDIIASKPEFFGALQRVYRAPGNGRIAALNGSWLSFELFEKPFELQALYRGTVVHVMPRLGVVIEAVGALTQGIWGAGGEGYGVLKKVVDSPDQILDADKIDVGSRGIVLLAGAGIEEAAIHKAIKEQVAGIIVGGIDPDLRELVSNLGLPTLVTDGLGECPMSSLIFELLALHNGDEVSLNTSMQSLDRPEVFIPAVAASNIIGTALPPPTLVAQVGARVRLHGGTMRREMGTIAEIPDAPRTLESGVSAWGADISTTHGNVFVPWENLELIDEPILPSQKGD